jgi:hypothetical protein
MFGKLKHKYNAWKINTGRSPRGRTALVDNTGGFTTEGAVQFHTMLSAKHIRNGEVIDERTVYEKVVTTAGVTALSLVTASSKYLKDFNYHDCGTGTGDEAVGDTALGTAWGGARVAGTQSNPSGTVYQSVATITFNDTFAITEHGLFSASESGTLWDRTKFAAINVISGDSIQFTYQNTSNAGG